MLLSGTKVVAVIRLERMIWLMSPTILDQKNKKVILPHSENPSFPQFLKRLAQLLGFNLIPFQESTGCLIDRYLDQKPSCNRVAMPLQAMGQAAKESFCTSKTFSTGLASGLPGHRS